MDNVTNVYVGTEESTKKIVQFLKTIIKNQETMANSISELTAQVQTLTDEIDALKGQQVILQATVDNEQTQVAAALAGLTSANENLEAAVIELQQIVANGGTEAERQALTDKITAAKQSVKDATATLAAIKADVEGTIPDAPVGGEPVTE